jgi:RAMP superfamily
MPRVEVALAVTVHGALATRACPRDARGRLLLPASQVKGRLRHACEQVARGLGLPLCRPPYPASMCPHAPEVAAPPCAVCALFGAPAWPSPLRWRDLRADAEPAGGRADTALPSFVRAGVALDRRLGIARPDTAYLVETSPPLPQDGLRLTGDPAIAGHFADGALLHLLLAGCRLAASFGAGETRGLGWSAVDAAARLDGEPVAFDPALLPQLGASARASSAES